MDKLKADAGGGMSAAGVAPSQPEPEAYAGPVTWTPEDEARLDAAIAKRNAARATRGVMGTKEPGRQLLERAYEDGWCAAAHWAKREDLEADIGSPAYIADRDGALDALGVALPDPPYCPVCGSTGHAPGCPHAAGVDACPTDQPDALLRELLRTEEAMRVAASQAAFEQAEIEHACVRKRIRDFTAGVDVPSAVNPPEFQEVSYGVDSVMRPAKGMAISEHAFRQWAKDVGIVLAAGVRGPGEGQS